MRVQMRVLSAGIHIPETRTRFFMEVARMAKLTAVQVRNARKKEKAYKLADGQGLNFHVAPSGKKTWRYRFRLDSKESTYVLGEYPDMSLEQARTARAKAREKVKAGINPAHERKEKKQAAIEQQRAERELARNSFEAVAREWMQQQGEPGYST
ncbi:MAG: DUF4102 domain-containing protein [Candidatus Electrothrix sp. MAN1_4]|nr:DUF4102 domain-containing protein [Candidatus Electrothrix sp. MAN1_4]